MADALSVRVVSPARVAFEGQARAVTIPAWDGRMGVLPGHAPLIALLGAGPLIVDLVGGGSETVHVAAGVVRVDGEGVTVLADYADREPLAEVPESVVIHPEDLPKPAASSVV